MIVGIDAHNLEGNRTGVGRYLFNLLKIWHKLDFEHFYHTTEYDKNTSVRFILYFKDEIPTDLPQSDWFVPRLLKAASTAKFIHWDLPRAAKKDKVDVLFCPGYVAPLCYKGKIALALHDIIYEAHPGWFNWPSQADKILLKWVSKKAAQKAAIIFTPSEFTRQEVLKYYRVPAQKVVAVPLAVDTALYSSIPVYWSKQLAAVKDKYGIKKNFVFYVGSIFSRRHLSEIIEAFSRLAKEEPAYQLLLGGKDYIRKKSIEKLVSEKNKNLGREAILQVDFIGDFELKLLYSACAFFIWLSDYEGFGLPVLEAMAGGAPVITSDSSSLKEVAGEAALLVKNNFDVEEIYRAMRQITKEENLRAELIKKGKEQAGKFSWEKCAQITLEKLLASN